MSLHWAHTAPIRSWICWLSEIGSKKPLAAYRAGWLAQTKEEDDQQRECNQRRRPSPLREHHGPPPEPFARATPGRYQVPFEAGSCVAIYRVQFRIHRLLCCAACETGFREMCHKRFLH